MYTIDEVKNDFNTTTPEQIYNKYILNKDTWYFKLNDYKNEEKILDIIYNTFGEDYNISDIKFVGSAKTKYSFSPSKEFKEFDTSKGSDLDIVIISEELFNKIWRLFREGYTAKHHYIYKIISLAIYRGYIDERNIIEVNKPRIEWNKLIGNFNKEIQAKYLVNEEINFRIYRNYNDFKEYNIQSIKKLKISYKKG